MVRTTSERLDKPGHNISTRTIRSNLLIFTFKDWHTRYKYHLLLDWPMHLSSPSPVLTETKYKNKKDLVFLYFE